MTGNGIGEAIDLVAFQSGVYTAPLLWLVWPLSLRRSGNKV